MKAATFTKIPRAATRGPRLHSSAYHVLGVLSDRANADGWSWPSHQRIAKDTGLSERSVREAVNALEADGYIAVERGKPTGRSRGKTRNRYRVLFKELAERPDEAEPEYQHDASGISREYRNENTGIGAGIPEVTGRNTGSDGGEIPAPTAPGTRLKKNYIQEELEVAPPPDEHDEAVRLWNETAEKLHLPRVKKLIASRRSKLRARLRECGGIDGWRQALAEIERSRFLRGDNGRQWKASFDFMLQESSFTRLTEGAYRDTESRGSNGAGNGPTVDVKQLRADIDRVLKDEIMRGRLARGEVDDLAEGLDCLRMSMGIPSNDLRTWERLCRKAQTPGPSPTNFL